MHVNLHKTFGTPHGGGGPGSGPVGVKKFLEPFLPGDKPNSIGQVAPFHGNFAVCLKAYAYISASGGRGLTEVSEQAVLNANYVLQSLKNHYDAPYVKTCMHECVLTPAKSLLAQGIHALDIAKALIDRGFHPPTVYFPLIVKEAMMIEPTETESKETLDAFIEAMVEIAGGGGNADADSLKKAPITTPVGRLNETKAAKDMDVAFL